jgi:hypothetical protein
MTDQLELRYDRCPLEEAPDHALPRQGGGGRTHRLLGASSSGPLPPGTVASPQSRPEARSLASRRGNAFARRWFELPPLCERCEAVPPHDRHHKDANPQNNDPSNIAFLCCACHQDVDGRREMMREFGRRSAAWTHCKHGHPFDETNTYVDKIGKRHCRACSAARQRRRRAMEKERAVA